ncbi:MAG TPA: hypothetical protein VMW31_00145, partial [Devosiaceae bacterium]|nr:hypothetical protein [Devosiaceae bacterium]
MRPLPGIAAAAAVAALAGCASLDLPAANALRSLDLLNDDIAELVLALDLPSSLVPVADETVLSFVATTPAAGERRVEAVLVTADSDAITGSLPPPGRDRAYYVFGISQADQQALREAQRWGRELEPGFVAAGGTISVSVRPALCSRADFGPALTTVSALVALPGGDRLQPLISNVALSDLLARAGAPPVPSCDPDAG